MGAVDTRDGSAMSRWSGRVRMVALFLGFLVLPARAQQLSGSMRLDYQNTDGGGPEGERVGTLLQHYYVRAVDRLFTKNLLTFTGNFAYRAGNTAGQPVEFRPRYELQMTGIGYGGRAGYEPYTLRRGSTSSNEVNRRWRANAYIQPNRWPRLIYDMSRFRQERETGENSRDDWNSYAMNWQPGTQVFSSSYSRQARTPRDSIAELLETYRALASTDIPLPGNGRLGLAYNYDRTWRRRSPEESGALDQHVPTASFSAQPAAWIGWNAQYTGRYIVQRDFDDPESRYYNDQLASGSLNLAPVRSLSLGVVRYYEKTDTREGLESHNTDYWQVRGSAERTLFRQIRSQFTVYRIMYSGAEEGVRFSDAYFAALRGRPHRHAELSTEAGFADRHGLQARRYAVNLNSYLRLFPTHGSQMQIGYNTIADAVDFGDFDISEETFASSLQYYPDARLSVTLGETLRRNRLQDAEWKSSWNGTVSYRWPGFANVSVYYVNRESQVAQTIEKTEEVAAQESWLATLDWWVTPATTLSFNYSLRSGGGIDARDLWGLSLSTQF